MRKREEKDGEEGWMWRIDEKEIWERWMRRMDAKDIWEEMRMMEDKVLKKVWWEGLMLMMDEKVWC